MALSLAHQSRIRHLYPQSDGKSDTIRPDSSSSASSATDWDSGHATVLRRQTQHQVKFLWSKLFLQLVIFCLFIFRCLPCHHHELNHWWICLCITTFHQDYLRTVLTANLRKWKPNYSTRRQEIKFHTRNRGMLLVHWIGWVLGQRLVKIHQISN